MEGDKLILGFVPLDNHWVVVNPQGRIMMRFTRREQAQELFDTLSEMEIDWETWDIDVSALDDEDLDKE